MILAVPPAHWQALQQLCASEDVEATALGTFEETGRLQLFYEGEPVADLAMQFLHEGRPDVVRQAVWSADGIGVRENADVIISNHTIYDGSKTKLGAVQARKPGEKHPYVVGNDVVRRYLQVVDECAQAALAGVK